MLIVGLMSGTSGDGIDAALCAVEGQPPQLRARIVQGITLPYDDDFRQQIFACCQPSTSAVDAICRLNAAIGERFAEAALAVIDAAEHTAQQVDLIASHGQTLWHDVAPDGRVTSTLQVGAAAVIAERTGITTISDFRPRDVAAGGQGAPLTAYADWLLLRHPQHWRAVQNIGGMGNVTFLPPLTDNHSQPLAFDTGPGNALIDAVVYAMTDGAQTCDVDGELAAQGTISETWLAELLDQPYFHRPPPKTTGRELFGTETALRLLEAGHAGGLDDHAIVATLTALTAASIAQACADFAPQPIAELILGGGGRHNPTLVSLLGEYLPGCHIQTHEDIGLNSDFKEALVFAILAYETWHNRPGVMPALTGATRPVVLGGITPSDNYSALIERTWR